jgi:prepilin-type processing-associated H-X9-DG protein
VCFIEPPRSQIPPPHNRTSSDQYFFSGHIIAILAAILFPVFARAREKARQTNCMSNVKQMGIGFQMYCQDYDEVILPARLAWANTPPGNWGTGWTRIVEPYMKNTQLYLCPSHLSPTSTTAQGTYQYPRSYGVNYHYHVIPSSTVNVVSLARVEYPSQTISLTDSNSGHPGMNEGNASDRMDPRHNEIANVLFMDGHAKAQTVQSTIGDDMWTP